MAIRASLIPSGGEGMALCKYMSGLGLFCTADHVLCDLSSLEYSGVVPHTAKDTLVRDIITVGGNKLTDGAGMISSEFMRELEVLHPDLFQQPPYAAFQFRLYGLKGAYVRTCDVT